MSEHSGISVLRRKAQIGQEQFKARAMTAARALRLTLSKVAEDDLGLALAAIGLTEARCAAGDVLQTLDETTLLILLDSPGRGSGAAMLDAPLASAIVQQLTMGRVSPLRENQPARKPTKTDAALVAPMLESLFQRAGPLPDTTMEMQLLSGLRFGADIANTRLLAMSLEAEEYAHFAITVDVAGGTRQGKLDLLLPLPATHAEVAATDSEEASAPPATLESTVMALNAQLRVALCRMRMPFSQLADLQPGDTLPLPDGVLGNAELLTVAGRKIAIGKLGQINGLRAIRLETGDQSSEASGHRGMDQEPGHSELRPLAGSSNFRRDEADDHDGLSGLPPGTYDDLPELPDLPDLPSGSDDMSFDPHDLPELPDLPDLPDLPGDDSGFGDLSDLPELPELPMAKQA